MPTKICGITQEEDALEAARLGARAIGMIFYSGSPRYIPLGKARTIAQSVASKVRRVGVFVNASRETILEAIAEADLDMIQFSGSEPPDACHDYPVPVIKAFHVDKHFSRIDMAAYHIHAGLLDTYRPGHFGGTGKTFDWAILDHGSATLPIILAGGLTPDNVSQAIREIKPQAVDISSGVESAPGVKDHFKLRALFNVLAKHNAHGKSIF